jgi:hypothetical protein
VIGKVLRGKNARRLLYYLYGPGPTSTPTRTWSPGSAIRRNWNRSAARTGRGTSGAWPGSWSSP